MPFAAISGIFAGFSLGAIKNAVVKFADLGEAIQKGALKAGMSVQQYQRMKYVSEQSGTSIEAMEGSLSKLNRTVGDAAAGKNQSAAALMSRMGIATRDANGQVRSAIDLLPEIADGFKRNENPTTRARMGMALFGKSYAEILPLLVEGSAGIKSNIERFNRLKGVLSPEDVAAAKDLGDSFKDLDLVMQGFQGTIAKALIPVIQPMIKSITDWWVANKQLVGVEVGKMAKDFGVWVKSIDITRVTDEVRAFSGGLKWLIDAVGGAQNALIGLVLYMNLPTIQAMLGLLAAVGRLTWGLIGLAWRGVSSAVTGLMGYTGAAGVASTATTTLNARVGTLLGTLGLLAAALAPIAAMGAVTAWADDKSHDKERVNGLQGFGNGISGFLGNFGFNKDADIAARLAANRAGLGGGDAVPSALGAGPSASAGGKFTFVFRNAPPGFQVSTSEPNKGTNVDVDVGYRLAPGRF